MHNVSGASIVLLYLSLINCLRPVRSKRNQCFSLCFSRGLCNEIRNVSICLDHRCFDIYCINVKYLPADDHDRSKHIGVLMDCL